MMNSAGQDETALLQQSDVFAQLAVIFCKKKKKKLRSR